MNKIKTGAILVISGASLIGSTVQVHTPVSHRRANPEVIANYLAGHKWYNPQKHEGDWKRSEARKAELMDKIVNIRKQIRNQAESYRIDRNTTITGYTASQKTVVNCTKLMNKLSNILS